MVLSKCSGPVLWRPVAGTTRQEADLRLPGLRAGNETTAKGDSISFWSDGNVKRMAVVHGCVVSVY